MQHDINLLYSPKFIASQCFALAKYVQILIPI